MKPNAAKFGGTLFLRAVIASVLAAIVYMSVAFIFTSMGTKVIGYTVYRQSSASEEMEKLGDYYYKDLQNLEDQAEEGTTSTDEETGITYTYYRQSIRSEMSASTKFFSILIAEICMLGIYISMLYVSAWETGNKDRAKVKHDGQTEDKQFGLKSGLYASIPIGIAFVLLIGSKLGMWLPTFAGFFKIFLIPFFPLVVMLVPSAESVNLAWWVLPIFLAMMALKPLTCDWAYRLGYKDKMLRDFFLYKSKKSKKKKSN